MLGVHSQQLDLLNAVKKWDGKEFSIVYMIDYFKIHFKISQNVTLLNTV